VSDDLYFAQNKQAFREAFEVQLSTL